MVRFRLWILVARYVSLSTHNSALSQHYQINAKMTKIIKKKKKKPIKKPYSGWINMPGGG